MTQLTNETQAQFHRFCQVNWELTSIANPWANAWADFLHYRDNNLLDLETGTILNPDGTPKPKQGKLICMVVP